MKTRKHETLTGEVIEYQEPAPEVAAFLDRVVALANDPRVTEDEMIGLVYGTENPILVQGMFEGRGAVTRDVFEDPLYHVLLDWLGRKRQQLGKLDMGAARAAATMSVAEAAAELGVHPSAVRQAIASRRLAAVKVGRGWRLDPRIVRAFKPAPRGPESTPALELRIGSVEGKSFRIKIPGFVERDRKGQVITGTVEGFRKGAIAFSGRQKNRMFVIEPAEAPNEFTWGPFYVRGRYRVVETINNPGEASVRFKGFVPERTEADKAHRRRVLAELVTGQDEQTQDAVARWDGEEIAIVQGYERSQGSLEKWHLDLCGWVGGSFTRSQADKLKRELRESGVDFGTRPLTKEFINKQVEAKRAELRAKKEK